MYEEIKELKDIRENAAKMLEAVKISKAATEYEIAEAKKSEHFVTNLGKKQNFKNFLGGIIRDVIANDLTLETAKAFYKIYNIKSSNQVLTHTKEHCLNVSSYKYTSIKIAKLMQLALENQNKIDENLLNMFSKYINLKDETKSDNYKKILQKHVEAATNELDQTNDIDYLMDILNRCTRQHANKIVTELRWYKFE